MAGDCFPPRGGREAQYSGVGSTRIEYCAVFSIFYSIPERAAGPCLESGHLIAPLPSVKLVRQILNLCTTGSGL